MMHAVVVVFVLVFDRLPLLAIKIKWRNIDIRSVAKHSQLLPNLQQIQNWSLELLIELIQSAFEKNSRRSTFCLNQNRAHNFIDWINWINYTIKVSFITSFESLTHRFNIWLKTRSGFKGFVDVSEGPKTELVGMNNSCFQFFKDQNSLAWDQSVWKLLFIKKWKMWNQYFSSSLWTLGP